jgi:hypothetical protein
MAKAAFHLTVSECKRLIAKGVAALPEVRHALKDGTIAVCKGSTNAYVVEELLGRGIVKATYLTGNTQPAKGASPLPTERIPDVVLRNGEPVDGLTAIAAAAKMGPGDVLIKGANALSHDGRMAGVLVGDPTGGTVGNTAGHIIGKGITQIIPVGLEKTIPGDLWDVAEAVNEPDDLVGSIPRLWISQGFIVTEVEAVFALTGADASPMAAGGINGAEGAVWLLVQGELDRVQAAVKLAESLYGEPPFGA